MCVCVCVLGLGDCALKLSFLGGNIEGIPILFFSMQVCKDTQVTNANIKCAQDKTIKNT